MTAGSIRVVICDDSLVAREMLAQIPDAMGSMFRFTLASSYMKARK